MLKILTEGNWCLGGGEGCKQMKMTRISDPVTVLWKRCIGHARQFEWGSLREIQMEIM